MANMTITNDNILPPKRPGRPGGIRPVPLPNPTPGPNKLLTKLMTDIARTNTGPGGLRRQEISGQQRDKLAAIDARLNRRDSR